MLKKTALILACEYSQEMRAAAEEFIIRAFSPGTSIDDATPEMIELAMFVYAGYSIVQPGGARDIEFGRAGGEN